MKQRQFPAVFITKLGPQKRYPGCLCIIPAHFQPRMLLYFDIKTCDLQKVTTGYQHSSPLGWDIKQVGKHVNKFR
jgi:hypothetical protein